MADDPETYDLKDERPPRRRYVPLPDNPFADDEVDPPRGRSFADKFLVWDPFPLLITVVVLTWVGLGLWARRKPAVGLALAAAGLATVLVGEIYLYALIVRESGAVGGLLSFFFDWYRLIYLHMNLELTLRPKVIVFCGVLMVVTGLFTFVKHAPPG